MLARAAASEAIRRAWRGSKSARRAAACRSLRSSLLTSAVLLPALYSPRLPIDGWRDRRARLGQAEAADQTIHTRQDEENRNEASGHALGAGADRTADRRGLGGPRFGACSRERRREHHHRHEGAQEGGLGAGGQPGRVRRRGHLGRRSLAHLGLRKIWEPGAARPYVGGGIARLSARTKSLGVEETDTAIGGWVGGGIFWRLGSRLNIGIAGRVSSGKVTLSGQKVEAGGTFVGGILGWGWPAKR